MDSWLVFRRNRVILNQWTNGIIGPLNGFPKRLSYGVFPSDEILTVSQIGIAFHRICPPIFIQTWLQQYCRGTFLYSAHCSFSNPICFWSVWCRRTKIPGKILTSFAKFQGIVSVNDSRLPIWLQELLQVPLCFLWSFFCTDTTGSIGWPNPAPRLHIDDYFEIHILHWELCGLLLSSQQFFQHEVRLRHCVFCTEPL